MNIGWKWKKFITHCKIVMYCLVYISDPSQMFYATAVNQFNGLDSRGNSIIY